MDVVLPNGVTIRNIPEGTTKEAIMNKAIAKGMAKPEDFGQKSFSASEMVRNIPSSAGKYLTDIGQAVTDPKTIGNLGNLALGVGQKLIPGRQPQEAYADAVYEHLKQRYDTPERLSQTLMTDPVGTLSDVSGMLTGGGTLAKTAVGRAGMAIDPINAMVNTAKYSVSSIPKGLPSSMYQSAAKFPPAKYSIPERNALTETALNEKIMPSGSGIDKINEVLSGLDSKINDIVSQADKTGVTKSRKVIYSELKDLRKELSAGADAPKNLRQYRKIVSDLDGLLKLGPERLTPSALQRFKVKTYQQINWRGKSNAKTETLQALARGARKGMEDITPEIANVNKKYGPLAELRGALPQVANRIDNHNLIALRSMLLPILGGQIGDKMGALSGFALSMTDNPKLKAAAAIKLRDLQNKGLGLFMQNNPYTYMGRQGLYQQGRVQE